MGWRNAATVAGLWMAAAALAQITPMAKAQTTSGASTSGPMATVAPATRDEVLRGGYGPFRANNDLLFYHLAVRVDPVAETIVGTNLVRFRMLEDGRRIQLDLTPALQIDGITMGGKPLAYMREERAIFIDFPRLLRKGETGKVTVSYSGKPVRQGRFGCFRFDKDKEGQPWVTTACEGEGASVWWPCKDQWRDEPQDGMEIDVEVPRGLTDVSNGRLEGSEPLPDGYTRWRWQVHAPINVYDVALNIGEYQHFSLPPVGRTTLDFYALPEDLERAKVQFAQVPVMLQAFEHYFGEYPFSADGYKVVQVPYAGMEHQSAIAYGNGFANGYLGVDWTGVGISPRFDFILIHESGHEWFGNAVSAADPADMWIHEGWTTYMESLYVEYRWGKADALRYLNGLVPKVQNLRPILGVRGVNREPPDDQYFKGALMINTLRSVIDDDARWFADIHDFYQAFQYRNILTEDVVRWWSERTGMDLRAFFGAYLGHAALPVLELKFDAAAKTASYRWVEDEPGFAMPLKVGDPRHWTVVTPVEGEWKTMPWAGTPGAFAVATELYFVDVRRADAGL